MVQTIQRRSQCDGLTAQRQGPSPTYREVSHRKVLHRYLTGEKQRKSSTTFQNIVPLQCQRDTLTDEGRRAARIKVD